MANILAVGVATLDIISTVDGYPPEDSERRAVRQSWQLGGNAANTLVVLRQLGHRCAWAGTLAGDGGSRWVTNALREKGIDTGGHCRRGAGTVPTSCILRNSRSGSRTIVHYRDLEELSAREFEGLELGGFDWIHFEGRNVDQTRAMLIHAGATVPGLRRSVEVEKPRESIEQLFPLADVLMFSRVYARSRGFEDAPRFLAHVATLAPDTDLYCAWGEQGGFALTRAGRRLACPAFIPGKVRDTLAAGDTFNAAIIHGAIHDRAHDRVLEDACRLAGTKCGREGLDGLGGVI